MPAVRKFSKGKPSFGKMNKDGPHKMCRRCGKHSYHTSKKTCATCGFGKTAKLRTYSWQNKHSSGGRKR
ncbi:MAG: 50S ribosomal protein L37e [Nanoarchaeota archaeon]